MVVFLSLLLLLNQLLVRLLSTNERELATRLGQYDVDHQYSTVAVRVLSFLFLNM